MKQFFSFLFALTALTVFSQTPQIARVSSTGTTTIYTDLKKAISEAQDDDFIYVPGGQFNADSINFKKRINIVGAGHHPDSTLVTGGTLINGNVYCFAGGSGGSLQGLAFGTGGTVNYGSSCTSFTISKCRFQSTTVLSQDAINNSLTSILSIRECIVQGSLTTSPSSNIYFYFTISVSNSIIRTLQNCHYSVLSNCIISALGTLLPTYYNYACYYDEFRNCIINGTNPGGSSSYGNNNRYYNCCFVNTSSFSSGVILNFNATYDASNNATFQGGALPADFSYSFDYRVLSSSPAAGSGTDGTDRGIYGSLNPYSPNPYNPHIYYKYIAPTTNAQGQLQVNIKVKAQ